MRNFNIAKLARTKYKLKNILGYVPSVEVTDESVYGHINFTARLVTNEEEELEESGTDEREARLKVLLEYLNCLEIAKLVPVHS